MSKRSYEKDMPTIMVWPLDIFALITIKVLDAVRERSEYITFFNWTATSHTLCDQYSKKRGDIIAQFYCVSCRIGEPRYRLDCSLTEEGCKVAKTLREEGRYESVEQHSHNRIYHLCIKCATSRCGDCNIYAHCGCSKVYTGCIDCGFTSCHSCSNSIYNRSIHDDCGRCSSCCNCDAISSYDESDDLIAMYCKKCDLVNYRNPVLRYACCDTTSNCLRCTELCIKCESFFICPVCREKSPLCPSCNNVQQSSNK
jgi:hypothetical protein